MNFLEDVAAEIRDLIGSLSVSYQLVPGGKVPSYQTAGAAGMDLHARIGDQSATIMPGERRSVPVGVCVEIPEGFEGQVRPRSGLAREQGLVAVLGTIDSDYRGEVGVTLVNLGERMVVVRDGDRVAQLVVAPVCRVKLEEAEDLSPTARGAAGYGSTGR